MNTLKYKGYVGSVAYSEPDKVFFGKLEGIEDLVNYEGESVAELTAAFEEAVEDYLAFCKDHNVKPEKSYTGTFNVRIPPATHRDIANLAAEQGISINAFVKKVLNESLLREYTIKEPATGVLMDSGSPRYGSCETARISLPTRDIPLLRELAARFGWEIE